MGPPNTCGPTRWSRYSNEVTIPKLPPPPRRPQKRSAFSSALAVTTSPSAVTSWAESRLSTGTVLSHQPADTAAEREAGNARVRHDPACGCEPEQLRLAVEL